MYSDTGNTTSLVLGFPIRTSSDPRSVGSSPRHNAASHVLHRPLMPRHPPCALKHLQHKNQLIKNRNYTTTRHQENDPNHTGKDRSTSTLMLATTMHESNTTPHHQAGQQHTNPNHLEPPPKPSSRQCRLLPVPPKGRRSSGPVVSKPNSVFGDPPPRDTQHPKAPARQWSSCPSCAPDPHPLQVTGHPTNRSNHGDPRNAGRLESRGAP
jgi:hypothetical protein